MIEAQLISMGWTRQVTVRRHWPDRLEVRLHKVVPVARWGDQSYLAADGEAMELPDEHHDLPLLNASIQYASADHGGLSPTAAVRLAIKSADRDA